MHGTTSTYNRATSSPSTEPRLAKEYFGPKVEATKTLKTRVRSPSPIPSTSREIVYETPKQGLIPGIEDDDDSFKEEKETYGKEENVRTVASPPYMGRRFLDIH